MDIEVEHPCVAVFPDLGPVRAATWHMFFRSGIQPSSEDLLVNSRFHFTVGSSLASRMKGWVCVGIPLRVVLYDLSVDSHLVVVRIPLDLSSAIHVFLRRSRLTERSKPTPQRSKSPVETRNMLPNPYCDRYPYLLLDTKTPGTSLHPPLRLGPILRWCFA